MTTGTISFEQIKARRRVFLTGTPILNRPKELWTLCHNIRPDLFNNYWRFAARYCGGHKGRFGYDDNGATNLDELQEVLRSNFMVRRLKADVLKDLPAKIRQVIELPANGAAGVIAAEAAVYKRAMASIAQLRIEAELAKAEGVDAYKAAVARLRDGAAVAFQDVSAARRDTAIAKIPYVVEHLRNCSGKVIVFAHHHQVIDTLKKELGDAAVVLKGDTPMLKRQEAVDRFQNDPSVLYFLGNMKAAGVGITLTASSHVLFAELTYTPADLQQAEDRAHRIGQKESVLVQHLVLEDSIDARMAHTVVRKMGVIEQALDTEHELPELELPALPDPAATEDLTFKRVETEAPKLSDDQIAAAHEALRLLAAMDTDHAREQNAMGFNKLDTEIGNSLAARDVLTPKQGVLANRIARKYHRQLPPDLVARLKGE